MFFILMYITVNLSLSWLVKANLLKSYLNLLSWLVKANLLKSYLNLLSWLGKANLLM